MTIHFDDDKEEKELQDLQKSEEEDLVAMLAKDKYDIPYINLALIGIENDALRTMEEAEARLNKSRLSRYSARNCILRCVRHSPTT
jgi:hypothetical protein